MIFGRKIKFKILKLEVVKVIENADGSISVELDYDTEFQIEFEKKYKKKLTDKVLSEYLWEAVEQSLKKYEK